MLEAYRRTRKDGALGIDGQSSVEYAQNLEGNLRDLLERAKSGLSRSRMREFCMSGSARGAVRLSTPGRPYRNLLFSTVRFGKAQYVRDSPYFSKRAKSGLHRLVRAVRAGRAAPTDFSISQEQLIHGRHCSFSTPHDWKGACAVISDLYRCCSRRRVGVSAPVVFHDWGARPCRVAMQTRE